MSGIRPDELRRLIDRRADQGTLPRGFAAARVSGQAPPPELRPIVVALTDEVDPGPGEDPLGQYEGVEVELEVASGEPAWAFSDVCRVFGNTASEPWTCLWDLRRASGLADALNTQQAIDAGQLFRAVPIVDVTGRVWWFLAGGTGSVLPEGEAYQVLQLASDGETHVMDWLRLVDPTA